MDDLPRLVWLLLAGALPLLWLRDRMGETARGRKQFAALVALYVVIAVVALVALVTRGPQAPPVPRDQQLLQT